MDYFYGAELKQVVSLKKELKSNKPNTHLHYKIGELYAALNIEDSAYFHFYKVYEGLKNKPFHEDQLNILFKLHETASSKSSFEKDQRRFLTELNQLTAYSLQKEKWEAKYHLELAKDYFVDSLNFQKALNYYHLAKNSVHFNQDDEFKIIVFINLGNLHTSLNEFELSRIYLEKALDLSVKIKHDLFVAKAYINLGVNEKVQNNYEAAIKYFTAALECNFENFKPKMYRVIYRNLSECYKALDMIEAHNESTLILEKLNLIIDDFRKNSNFYEIDVKYQVLEKEEKINKLNQKFTQNKIIYFVLIFIVFLLALYSFVRWKKEDSRKKALANEKSKLEIEHSQTKDELEKIKQLVIVDHIILKNKAKIYLEDLIYIKAEDHYLLLMTSNKKEFVRGKLSEIISQLPPNFVKCHRSFIVNKNEVKQVLTNEIIVSNGELIPYSRGFKW